MLSIVLMALSSSDSCHASGIRWTKPDDNQSKEKPIKSEAQASVKMKEEDSFNCKSDAVTLNKHILTSNIIDTFKMNFLKKNQQKL